MTTQTLARLIIATAAVALLAMLLFSGRIAYAGKVKPDSLPPTAPTNLVVTGVTENTLPGCENTVTVKAVDQTGNTSAASAPLNIKLYPCQ